MIAFALQNCGRMKSCMTARRLKTSNVVPCMVSPSVREVVAIGVKVLVYTATASADEFNSMSIQDPPDKYFARACSIKGEAVNGE